MNGNEFADVLSDDRFGGKWKETPFGWESMEEERLRQPWERDPSKWKKTPFGYASLRPIYPGAEPWKEAERQKEMSLIERLESEWQQYFSSREYRELPSPDKGKAIVQYRSQRDSLLKSMQAEKEAQKEINWEKIWTAADAYKQGQMSTAQLAIVAHAEGVPEDAIERLMEESFNEKEQIDMAKGIAETRAKTVEAETAERGLQAMKEAGLDLPFNERELMGEQEERGRRFQLDVRKAKSEDDRASATLTYNIDTAQNLHEREMLRISQLNARETERLGQLAANSASDFRLKEAVEERLTKESIHRIGIEDQKLVQSAYEFEKGHLFRLTELEELTRQFDVTTDTGREQFFTELGQRADEFNATITKEGEQFNLTFAEGVRQFDLTSTEGMRQFQATLDEKKKERADVMTRFQETLQLNFKKLDLEIKAQGFDETKQAQVHQLAMWAFQLEVERFGEEKAIQRWRERETDKTWYWKDMIFQMDNAKAQAQIKEINTRIASNAQKLGFDQALALEKSRQGQELVNLEWAKFNKEADYKIEIPMNLTTDLQGDPNQAKVMEWITSTINVKTGKAFTPSTKQWEEAEVFLYGIKGDPRSKERLGINLSPSDFFREIDAALTWTPALKGFLVRCKYNEDCWQRFKDIGIDKRVYISDEEDVAGKPGLFSRAIGAIKNWWEPKTPISEEAPMGGISAGDIRQDAIQVGTRLGEGATREEMKQELLKLGWTVEDMSRELGGVW